MSTPGQFTTTSPSGTDYHYRVPANTTRQLILSSSQDDRSHASIFNNCSATLFIKFGSNSGMAVSGALGLYDVKITSASYYELPKPVYMGEIWGAWDADQPGGYAMVLQLGVAR